MFVTGRPKALFIAAGLLCALLAVAVRSSAQPFPTGGVPLYQAGRFAEALQLFVLGAQDAPEDPVTWTWLGATYLQLNQLPEAEQALRRAVDLAPQNPAAHLFLGITYARMGDAVRAREAFARAKAVAPGTEYDASASAWLAALGEAAGARSPGLASSQCPRPPAPSRVARPTVPVSQGADAVVEIASWAFSLEGAAVHVDGELSNQSDRHIAGIQVQATAYGINGRELTSTRTSLEALAAGDLREFAVNVPTAPPPIWVRLQVLEYQGRRPEEPRPAVLVTVPTELYDGLVLSRLKAKASVVPEGVASSHLLCVWIADDAGFPVSAAHARVIVDGYSLVRAERQIISLGISPGTASGVTVRWRDPMRAVPQVEIEGIQFASVP